MRNGTKIATRPHDSRRHPSAPLRTLIFLALAAALLSACSTSTKVDEDIVVQFMEANAADVTAVRDFEGAVVVDTVSLVVRDDPRFTEVRFHVDDPALEGDPTIVASEAPYLMELDTNSLPDGPHTLTVTATVTEGEAPIVSKSFYVANETDGVLPADGAQTVPAATLYAAPDGSDANDGRSPSTPLTVHGAAAVAQPGDVVYLRGGTYPIDVDFSVSGTPDAPVVWTSQPGEWAVFDGSDHAPISSSAKFRVSASWNVFMNLEVRNGPQEGIYVDHGHDNVFRGIVTHSHQYSGIANFGGDRNLYESITTYDNFDDQNPRGLYGDDADGIALSSGDSNVVRQVVTYGNSDDGIDAWRSTNTLIEGVVAYDNGRGSHGNGNGIKAGGNGEANHTIVRNSVAYGNKAHGFDDNSGVGITFENNTAYDNGGYSYMGGPTTVRRNNIAVGGSVGAWGSQDANNSWDLGIDDPRFVSTDPSHPQFLALDPSSPALGAGAGGANLGAIAANGSFADLIGPRTLGASGGLRPGAVASTAR